MKCNWFAFVFVLALITACSMGKHHGNMPCEKHHCSEISKALDAGDFKEWTRAMEKQNPNAPILKKVTAANFSRFVAMHELMKKGKIDEADKIRMELKIEKGDCGCMSPQKKKCKECENEQ